MLLDLRVPVQAVAMAVSVGRINAQVCDVMARTNPC